VFCSSSEVLAWKLIVKPLQISKWREDRSSVLVLPAVVWSFCSQPHRLATVRFLIFI
jgi:hypothetical protein